MAKKYYCQEHGSYTSPDGNCPYCAQDMGGPRSPAALGEMDELETQPSFASGNIRYSADDAPTDIIGSSGSGGDDNNLDETEIGSRGRGGIDETEIEVKKSPVDAILWVKEGMRRGHHYPVKNGTTIGRSSGSILLSDPKVSDPHAKFVFRNGRYIIADMLSTNGTFVNGKRITAETVLDENDVIKTGDNQFVLKLLYTKPKAKSRKAATKAPVKPRKTVKKS